MKRIETDVAIIGAGPTGLSLACQLVRYGVDFVIVEKNEGITPYSKALGVHARTLEIYEQLGLARTAVERGEIAKKFRLLEGGEVRAELPFEDIGKNLSPYPFMLILEQSKNEQLLYEYLQSHDKDVLWSTGLEGFSQDDEGVTVNIKTREGEAEAIRAKYLVGCDGAKSPVRHMLGLSFEGSTFERMFYVADAQVDWDLPHDALQVCLARDVFTAFFPMKGEKRYRIVGTFPEGLEKDENEVLYEEIEEQIKREAQLQLEISHVNWFSLYKVHTRRVNKFSEGRSFVAGDAAHIHSPAGAQGMNTGIQDVYNLAWKLALVIKERAGERLLETYNEERLENAQRLLETTDRMFELGAGSNWLVSFIRTTIFPTVAEYLIGFDAVKRAIFPLVSQIGINYRHGSLSDHSGDGEFEVRAGDRMPYFLIEGESVYDRLREPKFHLLLFSRGDGDYHKLCGELDGAYAPLLDCHQVPLNSRVEEIFGTGRDFMLLLRPDNYIGFISGDVRLSVLREYLSGFAGLS
ncbi:MAG TPA: FAD-dependent monooxygenase [Pyrinomonadaceae bacterium]|jgi:2-polyprenyl-6-methoxyphenol hydroxylase-like FAD-dependent oxidoreductase